MSAGRKVAAILVADIVGYSRLTGADEERTLARLRTLRSDLIDPAIAVHNGRIVKRTGDGAVVEFRSVVEAVRCAIEVQSGIAERNMGLAADKRIEARVGIHLGDVVEEVDGDLMGDGVNVAARLQSVGEPGGLCMSSAAYEQVRDKLHENFIDLGEQSLKNIARPIRVYALKIEGAADVQASVPSKPRARTLPRPLLAVALVIVLIASAWFGRHALAPAPTPSIAQMSLAGKYTVSGKVVQADNVGKHGEGFIASYEFKRNGVRQRPRSQDALLRHHARLHGHDCGGARILRRDRSGRRSGAVENHDCASLREREDRHSERLGGAPGHRQVHWHLDEGE